MFKEKLNSNFQRVLIIVQLCIAFSLLLWLLVHAFSRDYFLNRSQMALYDYVMGLSHSQVTDQQKHTALQNSIRFQNLPKQERLNVKAQHQRLESEMNHPFLQNFLKKIGYIFFDTSPFKLGWIVLAVVISILLLLKAEGAKQAVWLLPIISLAFYIESALQSEKNEQTFSSSLFPTERHLFDRYLFEEPSTQILEQKKQLEKAWRNYLVDQWAFSLNEDSSAEDLLDEAQFNFAIARINQIHQENLRPIFNKKSAENLSLIYLAWNLFFAWGVKKFSISSIDKNPSQ